jgi:hypothetical protein
MVIVEIYKTKQRETKYSNELNERPLQALIRPRK